MHPADSSKRHANFPLPWAPVKIKPQIQFRPVNQGDEARVLNWANDPLTRLAGSRKTRIRSGEHQRWFRKMIRDGARNHWMIGYIKNRGPIGSVRLSRSSGPDWEIHFSLDRKYRGKGWAKKLVGIALKKAAILAGGCRVAARVKTSNLASLKTLLKTGFKKRGESRKAGEKYIWLQKRIRRKAPSRKRKTAR
ncbi:MAG: N-acetyltransferase [Verrucomicrobia bacterium]|nr:N-acetyltransferase [Verrucomicrobiota bacterium]